MFDIEFLKILACPFCVTRPVKTKSTLASGELELRGAADAPTGLQCVECKRIYPIDNDGIPHLLIESAVVGK